MSSTHRSERVASLGRMRKNRDPPPRNGSKYRLNSGGRKGTRLGRRRRLDPAQRKNGLGVAESGDWTRDRSVASSRVVGKAGVQVRQEPIGCDRASAEAESSLVDAIVHHPTRTGTTGERASRSPPSVSTGPEYLKRTMAPTLSHPDRVTRALRRYAVSPRCAGLCRPEVGDHASRRLALPEGRYKNRRRRVSAGARG